MDALKRLEEKWQARWQAARTFEAEPDERRPKYFVNAAYPYMNGLLHIGHAITYIHAEIMARYQRMRGRNVLFPFGFHCTGMPIVAAANRIRDGEPRQRAILEGMGIPPGEIARFADPAHWAAYFPAEAEQDLQRMGMAIDWRRSFITTSLNPLYDRFIRWQFSKLREGGYVKLGRHPVVWCPKDRTPVLDHDRIKGEGETPTAFTLLKFRYGDRFLVAGTLRPETVFGQTNLWVDPTVRYVEADVGGERWILNRQGAEKLRLQCEDVKVGDEVAGSSLIGKHALAPQIHVELPILPSTFIDQERGTGIVTSVPSDAPDDWMALVDLKRDSATCQAYGLDAASIGSIAPIPIIRTEGWGPLPAVEICEKMGITSQDDRDKLEKAKEEIYRAGFYAGIMNERCGPYAGMRVEQAKEAIRQALIAAGEATVFYELTGEVVCRCLTPAVVKVVSNQWFLAYSDPAWKAKAHEALAGMRLYPEQIRKQFDYVLDWLADWACSREFGLGTRLPWDEHAVIESLSDSTVYMAYYTLLPGLIRARAEAARLTDAFFDYVLLGQGSAEKAAAETGLSPTAVEELRREHRYWYPFDLRISAKDLIQNHLSFCIFNHIALFDPASWPVAFGVNGWLTIQGDKMSKSRGTFLTMREATERWGADALRFGLAWGGEGLDDPTFDVDFVESVPSRLLAWLDLATRPWPQTRTELGEIDRWLRSVAHRAAGLAGSAMEALQHRSALKHGYFDLQRALSWYLRRTGGVPHAPTLREVVSLQTRMLAPIAPHLCEEVWERLGEQGFVADAPYPRVDETALDPEAERAEALLVRTLEDIQEIRRVTGKSPAKVLLLLAPAWKRELFHRVWDAFRAGQRDPGPLIKGAMASPELRAKGAAVQKFLRSTLEELRRAPSAEAAAPLNERTIFEEAREFLSRELGVPVEVLDADSAPEAVPASKREAAVPLRPAIYLL